MRKGGFEKPFQCILNDLQGLGRSVSPLGQYKALLMDCKRTVDSADSAAARAPQTVPLDSRCSLQKRGTAGSCDRWRKAPAPSKIVLRVFGATLAAGSQVGSSVSEVLAAPQRAYPRATRISNPPSEPARSANRRKHPWRGAYHRLQLCAAPLWIALFVLMLQGPSGSAMPNRPRLVLPPLRWLPRLIGPGSQRRRSPARRRIGRVNGWALT